MLEYSTTVKYACVCGGEGYCIYGSVDGYDVRMPFVKVIEWTALQLALFNLADRTPSAVLTAVSDVEFLCCGGKTRFETVSWS